MALTGCREQLVGGSALLGELNSIITGDRLACAQVLKVNMLASIGLPVLQNGQRNSSTREHRC